MSAREFCHGVRVVPQPSPARNPGGDCFACATTAALRHFYGDKGPTFDQVWEAFQSVQKNGDGSTWTHLDNTWSGMRRALYSLTTEWPLEIMADFVHPTFSDIERCSYSWSGGGVCGYDYARRLDAWLRAGNIAFAEIRYGAVETGPWHLGPEGKAYRSCIDHFVSRLSLDIP